MKSDLNDLMEKHNLDAILITGPRTHNPAMIYMVGDASFGDANLLIQRGQPATLFYHTMEREEAAKSGLATRDHNDYKLNELLIAAKGNRQKALVAWYKRMLTDMGLASGRVSLMGRIDAGAAYGIFTELQKAMPDLELVGDGNGSVIGEAMITKDDQEVRRIRRMGKATTEVVGRTAEFLCSHHAENNVLVKADHTPLTIGDVKEKIRMWFAELNVEDPNGVIFSIGRDAGIPHNTGGPGDLLRLGETIVFDIFPCETGGGYFYDMTRTWCLGYASEPAQALYDDVLSVYRRIVDDLRPGELFKRYQERTCELFDIQGHPTISDHPHTMEGYVHSLGHGVGMNIHERPFSGVAAEDDRLVPGVVFTIEPGLYYPDRGLGVRLEDTYWMRPDGKAEVLADYPLDLVLPVKGIH